VPLEEGYSRDVINRNIAMCIRERGPQARNQCVAMAFNNARRWIEKNLGGEKRRAALAKLRRKR